MYDRRYWRESGIWLLIYLGVVLLTAAVMRRLPDDSLWRLPAMLPFFAAAAAAFWIELRQLRRFDELQRAIYLEASLAALWLTGAAIISVWLLEEVGGLGRISPLWLLGVLGAGFGLGYFKARRRYR
ncbi:MAG: hypothetical protein ACPHN2_04975 [Sinimarinibacterium flocculans]|uniref:hypothetical protein n=1 Tax=Sinimarinibacterium flocculans TaxID=985250 RepID=UPI003C3E77F8